VGLGNDKFTNDSTQAILDRYNRFRDLAETVPRDDTERLDRGGNGGGRRRSPDGHGRGGGAAPNLDDSDVMGISLSSDSREALMKKLAREEPKEEPAPYGPLEHQRER
jgi:RNA-binding protein 23/39